MTEKAKITTERALASPSLKEPGKIYSDSIKGTGLYLFVTKTGTRRWLFVTTRNGKRREIALGLVDGEQAISLKEARDRARELQMTIVRGGELPSPSGAEPAKPATFKEYAAKFITKEAKNFRNVKHVAQWRMTIDVYAKPLHDLRLDEIETSHVLEALEPIWNTIPETAKRTQGRIERILDRAKAEGLRSGENPARYKGHLKELGLKKKALQRGHHRAMDYEAMPDFVAKLRERQAMSALALEFLILTAARTGEVIGARWQEIGSTDKDGDVWTVPAERMKAKRAHRVPLTARALEILETVKPLSTGPKSFIFPGNRADGSLSNMAMAELLKGIAPGMTVHGFRSTFRDWVGEETDTAREVAEAALAHAVGDATERAYRRGDAFGKRRKLMETWSVYLVSADSAADKS